MTDWNEELLEGAKLGDIKDMETALNNGADINTQDKNKWSALHWAAACSHCQMISVLVARGADIEIKCGDNFTPLILAANGGASYGVEALLKLGANPFAKSKFGTALDCARKWQYTEIIGMLEKAMADKQPERKAETPLERLRRQRSENPIESDFWGLSQ